jgi:hypothetical protein
MKKVHGVLVTVLTLALSLAFAVQAYGAVPPIHVAGTIWPQGLPSQSLQNNKWSGVQGHHLQQFNLSVVEKTAGVSLSYWCRPDGKGQTPLMSQGQTCGTAGTNIVGFAIQLSGPQAKDYDVFYSCRGGKAESIVLLNGAPCVFGAMVMEMGGTRQIDAMNVWISEKVKVANYSFRITSVTINHTRSHNKDTNHSFVSVFVNNAEAAKASSSEGDRADGTYHPTVVANVAIPRNSVDMVVLSVLNIGGGNWIQKGADYQQRVASAVINADKHVPSYLGVLRQPDWSRDLGNFANDLLHNVLSLLSFSNLCDGPVWADSRAFTGEQLFQNTTGKRALTVTKTFPGLNSPQGCGNNSLYSATWTVSRQ